MSKHTPGPWTSVGAINRSDGGMDFGIISDRRVIAEAFMVVGRDVRVNSLANARLIAAAPDLLAALVEHVRECRRECWRDPEVACTTCRASISAIEMATGEKPTF